MDAKRQAEPRLLDQRAAAQYLGISYWTLRDLCFRGELPLVRIGKRVLVDVQDLDAYIARCKNHSGA